MKHKFKYLTAVNMKHKKEKKTRKQIMAELNKRATLC